MIAGVARDAEVSLQVDTLDGVPLLLGTRHEHAVAHEAGVVHDDVEAAEGVDRGLHERTGRREVGDVGAVRDRLPAEAADLLDDFVRRRGGTAATVVLHAEIIDDHLRAGARERERMGAAEAAAGAGDDGYAAVADHWVPSRSWVPMRARA